MEALPSSSRTATGYNLDTMKEDSMDFEKWTRRILAFGTLFSIVGVLIFEIVRQGELAELAIGGLLVWGAVITDRFFKPSESG